MNPFPFKQVIYFAIKKVKGTSTRTFYISPITMYSYKTVIAWLVQCMG